MFDCSNLELNMHRQYISIEFGNTMRESSSRDLVVKLHSLSVPSNRNQFKVLRNLLSHGRPVK